MGAGGDGASIMTANGIPATHLGNGNSTVADLATALHSQSLDKQMPTMDLPADAADDWSLHEPVTDIDKRDAGTPDSWVPRHPQLIRLTGRHPFNVEPPPDALMARGFITPVSLHYVRNHGPVPKMPWDTHKLNIGGLVDKPLTLSMDQLVALPSVTIVCTLVCAGNRRKEQNMVKKSKGFSWGPAATGCSYWTGVRMSTLLRMAGVHTPDQGAQYVTFRGPIGELPQGGDGSYGTSITIHKAMVDTNDVIIAYKQNGRLLTPDHGFPCRMIIPGHIGGRMVKWLEEIMVTSEESQNFYHFHDNRVLPSHVDEIMATKEGWWFKPDYIINELNIQSTITSPAHEEVVPLDAGPTYTVRGYAFTGGTKVTRCEISLDDGATWRLADIKRFEKPNPGGKFWCWVHYELAVSIVDLLQTKEMVCRAWDASQNTQPNSFTWNLMGMMNNCIYRIKVHPTTSASGSYALRFEHPVIAGAAVGGWLNREVEQVAIVPVEIVKAAPVSGRQIKMAEVELHATKESAWFVRNGKVYDGTPFMKAHPGGADSILIVAGQDATDEFDAIHSSKAKALLETYYIGDLAPASEAVAVEPPPTPPQTEDVTELIALDPRKRQKFQLIEKEHLSHNVRRLRFGLQSPLHQFGLPVGKHVFLYAKINGETVVRAYSPISSNDDLGYFELVIKVYWKGQVEQFPEGGKMSQHLESLAVGDDIEVKGPVGHFTYLGRGRYEHSGDEHSCTHISMVAGGTGITPIWQIIMAVTKDAEDTTQLSLMYCNLTPDDVLLQKQLEALAAAHSNFKVWFTADGIGSEGTPWPHNVGRIDGDAIAKNSFPAAEGHIAGFCGPPGLVNYACLPNFKKMGYTDSQCILF